jgi:PHS family inorganic phosphate transporter-like MFS transporter
MLTRLVLDGVELMIIIIGTFAQALSGDGKVVHIIGVLVVWRFLVSLHLSSNINPVC